MASSKNLYAIVVMLLLNATVTVIVELLPCSWELAHLLEQHSEGTLRWSKPLVLDDVTQKGSASLRYCLGPCILLSCCYTCYRKIMTAVVSKYRHR